MQPDRERTRALVRRLRWPVIKPLGNRLGGDERSWLLGSGVEFACVREYHPGDDVRRIDWNLTARFSTPYVREAQADGAIDVWLLAHASGSVDWGTAECLKRYRAIELAAATTQLLGRHGNRLGLLPFADRPVALVPPGRGRSHRERVVRTLDRHPRSRVGGVTDLAGALESLDRLARRPSLVILVTDFLVPDGWAAPLRRLSQRHEVVDLRLRDPREVQLADIGVVTFEDPETGEQLSVDTHDRMLRERFAAAAAEQTRRIEAMLVGCRVDQVVLGTDRPLLPVLAAFLEARKRCRVARGGQAVAALGAA